MAIVTEIQVCGGSVFSSLRETCLDYLECLLKGTDREKIHFAIRLANGEVKHLTVRQEDNGEVVAYGDFEGLPTFLEFAQGED